MIRKDLSGRKDNINKGLAEINVDMRNCMSWFGIEINVNPLLMLLVTMETIWKNTGGFVDRGGNIKMDPK